MYLNDDVTAILFYCLDCDHIAKKRYVGGDELDEKVDSLHTTHNFYECDHLPKKLVEKYKRNIKKQFSDIDQFAW